MATVKLSLATLVCLGLASCDVYQYPDNDGFVSGVVTAPPSNNYYYVTPPTPPPPPPINGGFNSGVVIPPAPPPPVNGVFNGGVVTPPAPPPSVNGGFNSGVVTSATPPLPPPPPVNGGFNAGVTTPSASSVKGGFRAARREFFMHGGDLGNTTSAETPLKPLAPNQGFQSATTQVKSANPAMQSGTTDKIVPPPMSPATGGFSSGVN